MSIQRTTREMDRQLEKKSKKGKRENVPLRMTNLTRGLASFMYHPCFLASLIAFCVGGFLNSSTYSVHQSAAFPLDLTV